MTQPEPVNPLQAPLPSLRGIGSERAAQLARLELFTVGDLLLHRPRRQEDRRQWKAIRQLSAGEAASVRGTIVAHGLKRFRKGTQSVYEFILDDGSARLHCRWWNLPFMQHYFKVGDEVMVYGKTIGLKPRTMDHPETEVIETGEENSIHLNRIVPIYPLTEGLPQRWLRALIWRTLAEFGAGIADCHPGIPVIDLPSRAQAVHDLHFPAELAEFERARQRLALDELLDFQLEIQRRRQALQRNARALPCGGDNRLIRPLLKQLKFTLTEAQARVLRELRRDLAGDQPMRRLLQGDVGSGKTVVAGCCALMAIESGFSVALMAPTEVLAEQHYRTFQGWFAPLGIGVALQTGSRKLPANQGSGLAAAKQPASDGSPAAPHLVVGTHALIEDGFGLEKLGLVIIDEQHKFGVTQREKLVRKGIYPHLLVMTATPIPRTLGLTLYGDLDCSVLDQMPPGRGRVRTYVRSAAAMPKVWEFVRGKLAEGRQVYVVYPLIDESEKAGLKAVTAEYENLEKQLTPWKIGLLHGRLSAEAKDRVLDGFRAGELHVLLATTVIEVGIDVANATIMLIENAERFGLAQLHQLRGRIGRGAHESFCILVADLKTPVARERLQVLEETVDGFRIAEADLQLRGPGEFLGQQQSGLPRFRFAELARDLALVERARGLAKAYSTRA